MVNKNNNVQIVIGAALSTGFNSALSGAKSRLGQLGKSIKDLKGLGVVDSSSLKQLENRYASLISTINARNANLALRGNLQSSLLGVTASAAAISFPVREAMKFESAMADVKKVVDFSSEDGLQKMGNSLKELSRTIPLTVEGLAQIAAAGGQLGVKENDLIGFTTNVAKMSTAFDMLPDEAGKSMATLSNVFNIPINSLTKLGDAINHISNNNASTARNIVSALARTGGVVRQFGLSAEQASAFVGTLIAMGQAPEEAGTATAAMLQRLQIANKLGPKAAVAFAKLGLSNQDFPNMIAKDPQGALLKFFEAAEKIDPRKRTAIFYDIFGRDYSKTAATLASSLDKYRKQLLLIANQESYLGSMEKEFLARSATAANALQLLKNNISVLSIAIGDVLIPTIKDLAKNLSSLFSSFSKFIDENSVLVNSIIKVTSGLVGLKLGLVITRLAFTYIRAPILGAIAVFKSLRLGVSLVGTALKTAFMFSPIKSIFMLGTAAYFVVTNWKSVKEFFGTIWEGVFPYWQKFKEIMSDLGITQFIIDSWNNVSVIFKALWEPVKPLLDNFQSRIDELGITSKLLASWQKVKDFFESFITNISKKWESFKNSISSFVGKDSFIGKAISGTKNFVTSVVGQDNLNKIGESVSKFKNSVSSFFSYFNDKQPMANKLQQSNNHSSVNDNRNYTINVTVPEGASGQQIANLVKDSVYSAPTYSGVLYDKFAY